MFRIKICGVTNPSDACCAVAAGADAIGLNFYPRSPRCVTLETAQAIAAAAPSVQKIGLFVNETPQRVRELFAAVPLDAVQLHGDEPPEYLRELAGLPVVKAFRLRAGEERVVQDFVRLCRQQQTPLAAVLVDAWQAEQYGGTGQRADWPAAAALRKGIGVPMILAGGLVAENVAGAIAAVEPAGVDTSSGVEASPGIKDAARVQAFIAAARSAFGEESHASL